jgi:hypothetical protein
VCFLIRPPHACPLRHPTAGSDCDGTSQGSDSLPHQIRHLLLGACRALEVSPGRPAFGAFSFRRNHDGQDHLSSHGLISRSAFDLQTILDMPPGFASDFTNPLPTGSELAAITIGIDDVARWSANVPTFEALTTT